MTPHVLVVDNHDSFVHTLVGYLHQLGATTAMVEADAIADPQTVLDDVDAVLVSPGPGHPLEAGASVEVIRVAAERRMPLLGVCLGHQAIAVAFGGAVGEAPELMHGMVSEAEHDGTGLFEGLPSPLAVGRYHSLAITELPADLVATARTGAGTVMAVAHRGLPMNGVQFHPESVLTDGGHRLLANWLVSVGASDAVARSVGLSPWR